MIANNPNGEVTDEFRMRGRRMNQLVDALDLLEIPIDLIGEQRIEHVPEDLARSGRLDRQLPDLQRRPPAGRARR